MSGVFGSNTAEIRKAGKETFSIEGNAVRVVIAQVKYSKGMNSGVLLIGKGISQVKGRSIVPGGRGERKLLEVQKMRNEEFKITDC
jgi:hypothetical protein